MIRYLFNIQDIYQFSYQISFTFTKETEISTYIYVSSFLFPEYATVAYPRRFPLVFPLPILLTPFLGAYIYFLSKYCRKLECKFVWPAALSGSFDTAAKILFNFSY